MQGESSAAAPVAAPSPVPVTVAPGDAVENVLARIVRQNFEKAADEANRPGAAAPSHASTGSPNFMREIFFAGFPASVPHPSTYKDHPGGAAAVADRVVYSLQTVMNVFKEYGAMDHFAFDVRTGVGAISYHRGEDAESCFLSMNNAVIPGPVGDPTVRGVQEVNQIGVGSFESGGGSGGGPGPAGRPRDYVITCEFARCLPFVTPYLLLKDEFHSLRLSRELLRCFPVPEGAAAGRLAEWPTAVAMEAVVNDAPGAASSQPAGEQRKTVVVAPLFNDSEQDLRNPIYRASFDILKPSGTNLQRPGSMVRLLQLWWEYYHVYMLHKTEPTPDRIKFKRDFLCASGPTVTQEIVSLVRDCGSRNVHVENASPGSLLRRLVYDDVYHCTLNALIMKQQFRLDPAFVSYLRDVYTTRTLTAHAAYLKAGPPELDSHMERVKYIVERSLAEADRGNDDDDVAAATAAAAAVVGSLATAAAAGGDDVSADGAAALAAARADITYAVNPRVQEWLETPLLEAAANVVANVRFLRNVKKGRIGPDGEPSGAAAVPDEFGYPGMTLKQEDADLYDEIITNISGFCGDGSLFSLLLLCESPEKFRRSPGHIGFAENHTYHNKRSGKLLKDCRDVAKAVAVPIVFVVGLVLLINYVASAAPEEDVVVATGWGGRGVRPTFESREAAAARRFATPEQQQQQQQTRDAEGAAAAAAEMMRRAKEEAEARGAKFNIELNADL